MPRKKVEPKQPERHFRPTRKKLKKVKKNKIEFSKVLCIVAVVIFTLVAIFTIMDYYALMRVAITNNSNVTPDAALPIASVTSILAAVASYCFYQLGIKNSRNKYGIDSDGQPFAHEITEYKSKEENESKV